MKFWMWSCAMRTGAHDGKGMLRLSQKRARHTLRSSRDACFLYYRKNRIQHQQHCSQQGVHLQITYTGIDTDYLLFFWSLELVSGIFCDMKASHHSHQILVSLHQSRPSEPCMAKVFNTHLAYGYLVVCCVYPDHHIATATPLHSTNAALNCTSLTTKSSQLSSTANTLPQQNWLDSTSGVHIGQSCLEVIGLNGIRSYVQLDADESLPCSILIASRSGLGILSALPCTKLDPVLTICLFGTIRSSAERTSCVVSRAKLESCYLHTPVKVWHCPQCTPE